MAWTLCASEAAIRKAGLNANSTIIASGAALTDWSNQAEAWINTETREDWVAGYATVNTNFQEVLGDVCSSKIAINIINYDMSGFTSRAEAQTMLDVNSDIVRKGIGFLKEQEIKEPMGV